MMRRIALCTLLALAPKLAAQRLTPAPGTPDARAREEILKTARDDWRRDVVHVGKWLTAAGAAAFTVLAANEHQHSRHEWNSLLAICHSSDNACALGPDGRYLRADAESLYQASRAFDRRANRWLLGAQASLITTAALFIVDLHPGSGPDNIPYPAKLDVGMRLPL
jgi:hypothetical protein